MIVQIQHVKWGYPGPEVVEWELIEEIETDDPHERIARMRRAMDEHPLPEGYEWLIVTDQDSPDFVWSLEGSGGYALARGPGDGADGVENGSA